MVNDVLFSSKRIDWETPQHLFDRLHEEFGFTLDVCADETNHKCKNYYDEKDDGLSKDWSGVVWMNPPYGRAIEDWIKKAYESSKNGVVCVCLIPVRSDTKWWHRYVMKAADIRLLSRRLRFSNSKNTAAFPVAVVVFNGDESKRLTAMEA